MARQLEPIAALTRHWGQVCRSPEMTRALRRWRREVPVVSARTPDELVAAARQRSPGHRDCPVLDALVAMAKSEELALEVVVQAMLPRWCSIIAGIRHPCLSRNEIASLVVSLGTETILKCRPETASTPTDYRLWSDTRHRVHRYLGRMHTLAEVPHASSNLAMWARQAGPADRAVSSDDLAGWVSRKAGVSMPVARLVVATRLGETTMHEVAAVEGAKYSTIAQRRARAERRLRHALVAT